jgi:RNA 2',3'-cyclic 3'-phosphodiesterase
MRTFIALELSQEVRAELSRLEAEIKKAEADVKWVVPENIHLTLKFLGDVDEDKIGRIKETLDGISSGIKSFEISLFKLGGFPNLNYPRVIWVGIDKGCSEVEKIAALVEAKLAELSFEKEDRPFSAHLTIGRVKSGKNKIALKEAISSLSARPASCLISHITLFQSTLTPHGPIYTALHKAALNPKL